MGDGSRLINEDTLAFLNEPDRRYLLARSRERLKKERAIRRRQRRALALALRKLHARVAKGRLKSRDKIHESVGRFKARLPKAVPFVKLTLCHNPSRLTGVSLSGTLRHCGYRVRKVRLARREAKALHCESAIETRNSPRLTKRQEQARSDSQCFRILSRRLPMRGVRIVAP